MWYCYMVRCADNSLYAGITTDLARRVCQHNGTLVGGARYTRSRRPVELAYYRACASRVEAAALERRIKKLSKAAKEKLLDHRYHD